MVTLKNGYYLSPAGQFVAGDIFIEEERLSRVGGVSSSGGEVLDVKGCRILPGFIDMHIHGAIGYDVMTAGPKGLGEIAAFLARAGTTSFLPTTITSSRDDLQQALLGIKDAMVQEGFGASVHGVHIEGPYINPAQKGCHDASLLRHPEAEEVLEMAGIVGAETKIHLTVAPEMDGVMGLIQGLRDRKNISFAIGHSDADAETVVEALGGGVRIFTHLFNGMRGIHHREPGVAGAALLSDAPVELICDGEHVAPEMVRLVYRLKRDDGIVLVTDAMQATGLGDGDYHFGGFTVEVRGGIARRKDGRLASSTLTLWQAVRNMMKFAGVTLEQAVKMASWNPARVLGVDGVVGSIEPGKRADLMVIDEREEIRMVFCRGKRVV